MRQLTHILLICGIFGGFAHASRADEPFVLRCEIQFAQGSQRISESLRLENKLNVWKLPLGKFFQVYRSDRALRSPAFRATIVNRSTDLDIQVADASRRYVFKRIFDAEAALEVFDAATPDAAKLGSAKCQRP